MAEERRSKLPQHDSKKVPDASATCPRCNYFRDTAKTRDERMSNSSGFPDGINQNIAQDILTRAFPQKQRSRE